MRLFDVTGFDDPSTSGVNEGEAVVTNSTGTAIFHHVTATEPVVSGTGLYDPFLNQGHNSGTSYGYNSDEGGNPANTSSAKTAALMLSDIPIVMINGVAYYEFRLDINEPNNSGSTNPDMDPGFVSLEQLKIYVSGREANVTDYNGGFASSDFGLVYDLDANEDTRLRLDDSYPGSGRDDYIMWIPVTEFRSQLAPGQDAADTYVTFFSQFGPTPTEDGGFEEWRVQDVASIKGIKFNDVNGNGVRDAGEQGLAGFTIYVDANNNNQYDVGELSTVTKADGSFSFYGFPVKDYPYTVVIREAMTDTQLGNYLLTTGDSSGDHVVTISAEQAYAVSVGNMPIITDFSLTKTVNTIVDGPDNGIGAQLDGAGDKVDFLISIVNTGNVALTNLNLSDLLEGATALGYTLVSNGNGDAVLNVGEEWIFRTDFYTITQNDLDNRGGGDGDIDNVATATANYLTKVIGPRSDDASVPLVYNPDVSIVKSVTSISGGNGNAVADWAGDRINYQIVVKNEGNISLTGVSLTDINAAGLTLASGDADGDLVLDVGETWTYTAYHDVTQEELDGKGTNDLGVIDGDGDTDNTATVDTDQTDPESSTVYTPLVYNPDLSIVKSVTSISGGNGNAVADWAGDRINYQIVVKNEGNISLTGVSLTDINAAGLTLASGDADGDLVLDVGETWTYTAYHDVTQEELDGKGTNDLGVIDGDGDTDNTATVDTDQTDPESSTVYTPLVYNPAVDLEKYVSVDGGTTWQDADVTTGPTASVNAPVLFQITIVNTGNITLTGITLTDQLVNATNGTTSPIDLSGYVLVESGTQDGKLDVGESATLTYSLPFAAGQHTNVATVTTNQGATDSDAANYWGMHNTGPGVRTPGFWSNLGFTFWDGIEGNEPKQAGTPGFADGELLYRVDSDGDGDIDGYDKAGLLIGDFDHDGYRSAGEDVIFISLSQAQQLINASNKTISSDWIWKLGRDTVATWLNGLAGNYLGTASDPQSPTHYLDDAVDWFQRYAGTTNSPFDEVFDVFRFGPSVKNGLTSAGDHNASQIHNALDYYNNNGMTQAGGTVYAGDADSNSFLFALSSLPPLMA